MSVFGGGQSGDPAASQAPNGDLAVQTRPTPPQGPGVVPPFAAPPTDGIRRRMWIGLSVGALALILCCVGGIGGIVALEATAVKARTNAATKVVTNFLTDWQQSNYAGAYQLLCDDTRQQISLTSFAAQLSQRDLADFTVGRPNLSTSVALVPVTLRFSGGGIENEQYPVTVNSQNESEVCPSK
jgi:hypothetical protein